MLEVFEGGRNMLGLDLLRKLCPEKLRPLVRRVFSFGKYMYYRLAAAVVSDRAVYNCPCCGLRFVGFTRGNFSDRPDCYNSLRYAHICQDVLCPFCHSLPRHRILAVWCDRNVARLRDKRILYFAAENGMMRWMKCNGIKVMTADLFQVADLKLDLNNIDQPDACWDVVFCNHVLEHVPDYKKALHELWRILKPGGMLICSFPIDERFETVQEDILLVGNDSPEADRERIRKFGQRNHLRVFGRDSAQLLEEAGFAVTVIDGETMPEEILPVVGPADYDCNRLFVGEKR